MYNKMKHNIMCYSENLKRVKNTLVHYITRLTFANRNQIISWLR